MRTYIIEYTVNSKEMIQIIRSRSSISAIKEIQNKHNRSIRIKSVKFTKVI